MTLYTYKSKIIRVVDGDTVDLNIDLGFNIWTQQRIRLLAVDSPERKRDGFEESTQFTKRWFWRYFDADIYLETKKKDSFGRWLGYITCEDDCLNLSLYNFLLDNNYLPEECSVPEILSIFMTKDSGGGENTLS